MEASLRGIALTGPYLHDRKQRTLPGAVKLVAHLQLDKQLHESETDALIAFLNALTDRIQIT